MRRRAGGDAAGCEASEAVRKSDSKSVVSVAPAKDGHSLARLERINRVGAEVSRSDGLVTDTALIVRAERDNRKLCFRHRSISGLTQAAG